MPTTITLEKAEQSLKELLQELTPGDTVILVEANGTPVAVLVSIGPPVVSPSIPDWSQRWRKLAVKIGQAWKTEQSGLQVLAEMRRGVTP